MEGMVVVVGVVEWRQYCWKMYDLLRQLQGGGDTNRHLPPPLSTKWRPPFLSSIHRNKSQKLREFYLPRTPICKKIFGRPATACFLEESGTACCDLPFCWSPLVSALVPPTLTSHSISYVPVSQYHQYKIRRLVAAVPVSRRCGTPWLIHHSSLQN